MIVGFIYHLKALKESMENLPKLSVNWLHIEKYTSANNYLLFVFSVCLFVIVLITLLSRTILVCLQGNSFSNAEVSTIKKRKKEDRQPIHHSVFDLAKTAYLPGHSERCMEVIKTCNYDVDWPEERTGLTLFLCACISGNKSLVNFMLERGAEVKVTTKDCLDSALYLATYGYLNSKNPELTLISSLLEAGCDVNQQNKAGFTALHQSASKGNILLTDFLLKNGADPGITTKCGVLPVQLAASRDHREVAELLAKYMVSSSLPQNGEPHSPVRSLLGLMSPPKKYLAESKVVRSNSKHRKSF
ncbi:serine/threonine-protein phosphatase 6 regulatory ankyrin repeat subunit C-like isoform X2 [Limulus polyphemus]|uniref:Alpha-latrotoxin n=1 Tax=Limulus polyphemus TaxID=6850 RepID=A0ABM1TPV1_LIMPO|nr:serine/threonine-protein phosphatase 6 regulatory ankyrin repeat subunit C-like isoform X2 [Limulus polyphemus]